VGKATLPRPPWGWRRCQELTPDKPYATRPQEWLPDPSRACHAAPLPLGNVGRGRVQNLNQSAPDAPDGNQDREGVGGGCRLACGCWPGPAEAALSREEYPPALPQLVAIDDCAMSARHVVEDAALDKRVYPRVAEQDQRCTIIIPLA
jgi:hypothetical protein